MAKTLEETLDPSMGKDAYIRDFVHSKDKRFAGKSKKERIRMALGAYQGALKEGFFGTSASDAAKKAARKKRYASYAAALVKMGRNAPSDSLKHVSRVLASEAFEGERLIYKGKSKRPIGEITKHKGQYYHYHYDENEYGHVPHKTAKHALKDFADGWGYNHKHLTLEGAALPVSKDPNISLSSYGKAWKEADGTWSGVHYASGRKTAGHKSAAWAHDTLAGFEHSHSWRQPSGKKPIGEATCRHPKSERIVTKGHVGGKTETAHKCGACGKLLKVAYKQRSINEISDTKVLRYITKAAPDHTRGTKVKKALGKLAKRSPHLVKNRRDGDYTLTRAAHGKLAQGAGRRYSETGQPLGSPKGIWKTSSAKLTEGVDITVRKHYADAYRKHVNTTGAGISQAREAAYASVEKHYGPKTVAALKRHHAKFADLWR